MNYVKIAAVLAAVALVGQGSVFATDNPLLATKKIVNTTDALQRESVPTLVDPKEELAPQTLELSLSEAVQIAVVNHYAVHIAEAKWQAANAAVSEIAAKKNPSFDFQFGASKFKEKSQTVAVPRPLGPEHAAKVDATAQAALNALQLVNPGANLTLEDLKKTDLYKALTTQTVPMTFAQDHGFQNTLSVTWPIWTGGRVESAVAAARYGRDAAEWGIYKEEADLKYKVTQGYYQLMEAQHFADIADTAVKNLTEHVKNVTQIYNAGVVARIDVLSSEVALADAREKQIKAQNAVQLARANMSNLLRLPTVTTVVPDTDELPHRAITIQRAQAIDYALAHRWELQQAALNVKASEEKLNVAKAGNKPTVALTANMSWQDKDFPGFENEDWKVAGGVSWPLYDGGATTGKVKGAKADLAAAEETYLQARGQIELDVTQAYLNIGSAEERIQSTAQAVEQAQEAYKIARIRYRAGVGINLDVLDAQLALDQARTNYITALYDYNTGLARLEQAMGVPAVVRYDESGKVIAPVEPITLSNDEAILATNKRQAEQ
ncbi:MAG: TolC family protein [Negativicoccus succinicivorans]|uniref:TolC family protein n=1 Tax=Negativicoccus succinicivorans TaxID=620903 RepID=UPI00290B5071|nr:TolC family protein [Negativicoccus succinicivorans]MDU4558663.1 TolC family protein [Negativicoccus succinicivorans]